ncbi:MAG: hypothetical protein INQ03_09180 [Candidatus Heimdallarchaeota archaeon]|nr:hypothetical protein [Candidatus Heimdallarchaeota archaeon]
MTTPYSDFIKSVDYVVRWVLYSPGKFLLNIKPEESVMIEVKNVVDEQKKGRKSAIDIDDIHTLVNYSSNPKLHITWNIPVPEIMSDSNNKTDLLKLDKYVKMITDIKKRTNQIDIICEEIVYMFYRLTNYKDGSFVPLVDLISEDILPILFNQISLVAEQKFIWKSIVDLIFDRIKGLGTKLPAPYHNRLGAFEKTDDIYQKLLEMEKLMDKGIKL